MSRDLDRQSGWSRSVKRKVRGRKLRDKFRERKMIEKHKVRVRVKKILNCGEL